MQDRSKYTYDGPIDHAAQLQIDQLRNKSVVITGGANGMGEECVRQFAVAGAYVTFGDTNEKRGRQVEEEILKAGGKAQFVRCDITEWDDQIRMFDAAVANSPESSCDIVIANAGISRSSGDSLWKLNDPNEAPTKPALNIVNVNLNGSLYTFKLATHYFRRQPAKEARDRCFIMTGSMVAYIDSPGNWEYTCTKYALRGLMRSARWSSPDQGIRINYVAPCYIKSAIRTAETEKRLRDKGVEFGYPEDVAACMMRIASDKSINGHSLTIVPRSTAKEGWMDAQQDDHTEEGYFKGMQEVQLKVIDAKWE